MSLNCFTMTHSKRKITAFIAGIYIFACGHAFAITHTSTATGSGNWSNPSIWPGSTVPPSTDNIIVASGQTITVDANVSVAQITVNAGGTLTFISNKTLTINGTLTVNGTVTMNGGDIVLSTINAPFILGANANFTWEPATNTAAGASLFVNGNENFAPTSTLIIKKWYNYTTLPLGSVVTGNFGNLIINTNSSGTILEWNQSNQFEAHRILGTLMVDQGWVTLDKSGAISNSTIGAIILKTVNSYFTAYNGTAAPTFTLNTSSITNNGGTFFGIFDGNGNITLNVTGNVTNTGNIKLIDNNGSMGAGVCNGNATMVVGGTFSQSTGDTRFIYNLYSTTSGIYNVKIGALNLTGGILMGHYSCHTSGAASTFIVTNTCTINMPNTTDKFRGIGLTNISNNVNNQKLNFKVGGDLTISGNAVAEFTSNAASGDETDSVVGNFQLNSCLTSFNYGTAVAAHNTTLAVGGSMTVNGGQNYLSRLPGTLISTINGNLTLTNGNLIVKGDVGAASLTINGAFNQSGGKFFHHSNYLTPTSDIISVIINGDFTQSAGTLNFDDCALSTAAHLLSINGSNYNLTGTGIISRTGTTYSSLYFGRQGSTQFNRSSNYPSIQQVKQYIQSGCTLNVNTGNIQLASSDSTGNYFMTILSGGAINMNTHQLFSNAAGAYCAIAVNSGATLKTGNPQGLYDGTASACINASANMYYYLDPNSIIEYNGNANQVVTGIGAGVATTANQEYGMLRINFNGIPGTDYVYPAASNIYVRTGLDLANGEFNLNGYELTIESGAANAITRTNGYIKSETNAAYNPSILTWKNVSGGAHEFPFGKGPSAYVPVIFTPTAGMGGDVSISTRATLFSDNTPIATVTPSALTAVTVDSTYAMEQLIDRWWTITANGFTANVTLSYFGSENTLNDSFATGNMEVNQWSGAYWGIAPSAIKGVTSGIGTVTINNTSLFSVWMVSGQPVAPVINQPTDTTQTNADDLIILSLGPNPFTNQFNVTYSLYQDGPVTIQMANQNGQIFYTNVVNGVAGSNNYTFIDTYNLAKGIYFLYMTYHNTTTTRKMIKA